MARANYTPDALLLLTNIQYNLTNIQYNLTNPRLIGQPQTDDLILPASAHSHPSLFDMDDRECKY
jgi:hypothetical protein